MQAPPLTRRITALDGWRGMSILCVVVSHLVRCRYGSHPTASFSTLTASLATWGVDCFFVISGFIITRLALLEYNTRRTLKICDFYIRRLFRIVPPFYVYLLFISVAATWGLIVQSPAGIIDAAAFTCNFPTIHCGWFPGHSWTLAYEEQFYLAFPFIFYFSGEKFRIIITSLFFFLLSFPFIRFFFHLDGAWHVASDFAPNFSFICVGSVVAAHEQNFRRLMISHFSFLISCGATTIVIALSIINIYFLFPAQTNQAYVLTAFGNITLPLCLSWLVFKTSLEKNKFWRFLNNPCIQFFGKISYSLYIWQMVFTAEPVLYLTTSWLLFPPLMLILASGSYYVVERSSIRLGKSLLRVFRTQSSPALAE